MYIKSIARFWSFKQRKNFIVQMNLSLTLIDKFYEVTFLNPCKYTPSMWLGFFITESYKAFPIGSLVFH